jgi:uncharacterized membrane protein
MSPARPDGQRTRFRRPLGVAVMAYKAALGLSEIVVGILLAVPSFDPQATFARLSAEELREDPGDRFVALVSRHLPALLHHRGRVAVGLIMLGLAKLVAAAAMWEGHEWGGYLLAATVLLGVHWMAACIARRELRFGGVAAGWFSGMRAIARPARRAG